MTQSISLNQSKLNFALFGKVSDKAKYVCGFTFNKYFLI
ncbi:hypothetical protein PLUTE_a2565 [Pseudoalteromonas luteoviolacea DSM 6061]|nr:hypothetical protein [Pseudoalteromonas luteoviolacea DSM 6061]